MSIASWEKIWGFEQMLEVFGVSIFKYKDIQWKMSLPKSVLSWDTLSEIHQDYILYSASQKSSSLGIILGLFWFIVFAFFFAREQSLLS